MNSNVRKYIEEGLAFTGFAVCSMDIAYRLRAGDIWQTGTNCGFDFTEAIPKLQSFLRSQRGVMLHELQFVDDDRWHLVATRSVDELTRRIEQVTGLGVKALRAYASQVPASAAPTRAKTEEGPPAHPCQARTVWFEARGLRDPLQADTSPARATRQRF